MILFGSRAAYYICPMRCYHLSFGINPQSKLFDSHSDLQKTIAELLLIRDSEVNFLNSFSLTVKTSMAIETVYALLIGLLKNDAEFALSEVAGNETGRLQYLSSSKNEEKTEKFERLIADVKKNLDSFSVGNSW